MSFTLNRVYTEWYRNKGYDFTITSSTAFDHKWIPERNVYDTISAVVDEIFANYLSRPNVRQPILTQYCDGTRVSCPDWMTQWGSKELGDQGYTPIEILRYFYGSDMYINTAEEIFRNPVFLAGIYTGKWIQRSKGTSASGTAQCDRGGVSGAAKDSDRRSVWTGNCGGGQKVSGNFLVCRRQEPWITGPGIRFHKFMWEFPELQN